MGNLAAGKLPAAPMPLELIEVLRRDWGVGYAESYGLTETSPVITTTTARETHPGSCGRAMGDTRLKVADPLGNPLPVGSVGELWAQGTAISAGYYRRPDETVRVFTSDGWFHTGDLVRMDEEGYVYIVDRAKDMINVGGEKVYPRRGGGAAPPPGGRRCRGRGCARPGLGRVGQGLHRAQARPRLVGRRGDRLPEARSRFVQTATPGGVHRGHPPEHSGKAMRRLLRSQGGA